MARRIRTGASLSKDQYWCVQYLTTVLGMTANDLMNQALNLAIEKVKSKDKVPAKPDRPPAKKAFKFYYNVDQELLDKVVMLKIQKNMRTWGTIDFVRYGLIRVLNKYSYRYPELINITKRYQNEIKESDPEELQEV